jgi:hypothetical protein
MNAPSVDIVDMLEAESSLGLTHLVNLFIGREPSEPSNCVTIFDTYGLPPQLNLTSQGYERPTVQIRVRNNSYIDGWTIIENIKNILHGIGNETWNGATYTVIYCAYGPGLLDWDDKSRARFIINFNVERHT